MCDVILTRKTLKQLGKLPVRVQELFAALKRDLEEDGPEQPSWKNYSKIGNSKYHCHLGYHYAACWRVVDNQLEIIEIYYVGSRESAPY